jgi:glycosyltransferase involved in cell wall biosynthesis
MHPEFLIVVTGYNCASFVKKCVDSLVNQTYRNFRTHIISDGSTDLTNSLVAKESLRLNDCTIFLMPENLGAACRRYQTISRVENDNFIILLMGLDDELLPDCLETIAEEYEKGKWMTYGNWINQNGEGLPKDFDLYFDEETHKNRDYRKVKYRSTAPNTFYKKLFDRIPAEDFKLNGKWIDTTTESEVMFSCLEMCGKERIGVIEKPIYLYNQNLPGGTQRRLGQEYKNKVYSEIIKRPKKPMYEDIKH